MKSWLHCISALMITSTNSFVQAQTPKGSVPSSVEAQVAARFSEKSGGARPDQVFKSLGGLYEILIGGEIYYVDRDVNFVIAGRMFDPRSREDLTQKRLDTALKVDFKSLPLDRAVKTVRGSGARVLATFEDPNCGYCKRLWQNIQDLKDVTIYTFLYPILSVDSQEKSKAIWCANDRGVSWEEHMVQNKAPPPARSAL